MEAIIEQSVLMHSSATPLLGHRRFFNRTFGPSSPTSHAHIAIDHGKTRSPLEATLHTFTPIYSSAKPLSRCVPDPTDNCFILQESALPTRPNRLWLTTTSPIKLRRITRSWRPFFIITRSIIRELGVLTGPSHPSLFVPEKPHPSMPTVVVDCRDGLQYPAGYRRCASLRRPLQTAAFRHEGSCAIV